MPTYDYICSSCQKTWEAEQRIVDDPIRKCPHCGKSTAKRQISGGGGFILKGGGWYADLYSSAKPDAAPGKASDESSASADSSEPKPAGAEGTTSAKDVSKADAPAGAAPASSGADKQAPVAASPAAKASSGKKPTKKPGTKPSAA